MKARVFLGILFVIALSLFPSSGTLAQGPTSTPPPPGRLVPPPEPAPAVQPKPILDSGQDAVASASASTLTQRAATTSRVPILGLPGTSFRNWKATGVTRQAYPVPDTNHVNAPGGLFIDADGNVYVTEDRGYRVLGYSSAGANFLNLGTPGFCAMKPAPAGFCVPQDVAKDASGNLWIADGNRVAQYSATGAYLQQLPAIAGPSAPWYSGNDNTHFGFVTGLAIDNSAKRMFVADAGNHRVQVYGIEGNPTYSATIGVTGEPGNDAAHLNYPRRLALDTGGQLYIVDSGNNRVQKCSFSGGWNCATFTTGLDDPQGIGLDAAGNVYIANSNKGRLVKCTPEGACNDLITSLPGWVSDVAVDAAGAIYLSDWDAGVVRKYDSAGTLVGPFVGIENVPYVSDTVSINTPWGIAIASDGSIYVTETNGNRLLKLSAAGTQLWSIGTPGVIGPLDKTHFSGPQGSLAIDAGGKVYVPDTQNFRIQVFNPDGTWAHTFGGHGTNPTELDLPSGVTINHSNGDIYVADRGNERVQVYNSAWDYKATLGTTGVAGTDGTHFSAPSAVALDSSGKVYVADAKNNRVQKCTLSGSSGTCVTLVGQTGELGTDFGHLDYPTGLAIDGAGRLYVADRRNNRIQVFTTGGAYLTTIAGSWGDSSGQMRSPSGLALDSAGNLWVTDSINHRIEAFALGVPDWTQWNINGFGDPSNTRTLSLASFGGQLYAGTLNSLGAGLYRQKSDNTWESVAVPGFGITANIGIDHLLVFGNNLYASTLSNLSGGNTAQIWRSNNGSTWSVVVADAFGDGTVAEISRLAVFNNQIYAATASGSHGAEVWRSNTGDTGSWTRVAQNGFGRSGNRAILSFEVLNGYLYAGTLNSLGGQVWRSDGSTWNKVNTGGFGISANDGVTALATFNGWLYAGVENWTSGSQIWRCKDCTGGDWVQVVNGGFGDSKNNGAIGLEACSDSIFASTTNTDLGIEIWKSATGDAGAWTMALEYPGFGDNNNGNGYYDNALTISNNYLNIGTRNSAHGGEVWQLASKLPGPTPSPTPPPPDPGNPNKLYLPLITH